MSKEPDQELKKVSRPSLAKGADEYCVKNAIITQKNEVLKRFGLSESVLKNYIHSLFRTHLMEYFLFVIRTEMRIKFIIGITYGITHTTLNSL